MNELDLVGCNNNWNQRALRNVISEYYKEIHNNKNHEKNLCGREFLNTFLKMKTSWNQ